MKQGRAFDLFVLATSLAAFAIFSLQNLNLPGLYYDEAADAVPAMQLVLGQKVEFLNQTGLLLGDLALPIMSMDYVGTVNTYLLVPIFALLGVNVISLRLLTILGSAATIVLSYFVAKELFDQRIAAVAVLLLAVHPSFVFWSRQGIHVTSIMTVMSSGSLLCLLVWRRKRNPALLYMAAFLLGLGLSAKLLFLWFILALIACAILLLAVPAAVHRLRRTQKSQFLPDEYSEDLEKPKAGLNVKPSRGGSETRPYQGSRQTAGIQTELHERPGDPEAVLSAHRKKLERRLSLIHLIGGGLAFLLGAWMILLYNILTQGTMAVLSKNLFSTGYGVNNLDFFRNLLTSLDAFRVYLRGENFWYLGGLFANDWYPEVLIISTAGTVVLLVHPQVRTQWQASLFPLLMLALLIIQSSFTVSGLWSTHYFIAYPFPQLVIAMFVVTIARLLPLRRLAWIAALTAIALIAGKDVYVNSEYHRVLAKTGGMFTHSDAIDRLAAYVDQSGVKEPIAMDWGIKTSLQILTQGRVNPVEIFQYQAEPSPVFFDWLYGSLTQRPDTLYIFHTEGHEIFPRYEAFLTLAKKLEKKVVLMETILRKDGDPLYAVYSAH